MHHVKPFESWKYALFLALFPLNFLLFVGFNRENRDYVTFI